MARQVRLAKEQIQHLQTTTAEEDQRRKRQATIDFYMATAKQVAEWREQLPDDWDSVGIGRVVTEAYDTRNRRAIRRNQRTKRLIASYLGFFETIAVAEKMNIYELETLDAIAGSRLINISTNYGLFFKKRREEVGTASAYEHVERLGQKISELPTRRRHP